jgi:hypothetical protein
MLDKTEHFTGKAETLLAETDKMSSGANYSVKIKALTATGYATLALVHAVNQLNETLKEKTVVQKSSKQQE